jgi:enoyl-CoA hydratase/carnithine racemase
MIEITNNDGIAILTMAHGKANAFDPEFSAAVADAFDTCNRSAAKAAVITARGGIFSAGVDLLRVSDGGAAYLQQFLPLLGRAFEAAFAFSKPLVAAVNGHAFAGGCILACAADRRLMARGAGRIGVPELLVGIPFPTVAFEIIRFAVPAHQLAALIFGGETFTADDAAARGLVDASVDAGGLMDAALAEAARLAALPPTPFAITKHQLRAPSFQRILEGRDLFDGEIRKYWESPGALDAIRAYVARTFKKS